MMAWALFCHDFDLSKGINILSEKCPVVLDHYRVLIMNYNDSIQQLLKTDGALAAAVVDYSSGMLLAGGGTSSIDLEIAAAGNTEVLRAKMKTMKLLDLKDSIDDVLITLGEQYHLLRPVNKQDGLCLYFVLDKSKSNLALARRALVEVEKVIK